MHVKHAADGTGFLEAWVGNGELPDVSQPPEASRYNWNTTYACGSAHGFDKVGIYGSDGETQTLYMCGYHRAATYAVAARLPNCPIPG